MRMFQNLVKQIEAITGFEFGITDTGGKIISSSDDKSIGSFDKDALDFINSSETDGIFNGRNFIRFLIDGRFEYVFYLCDPTSEGFKTLSTVISGISGGMKFSGRDKQDRTSLINDILLSRVSNEDMYGKAKEFKIVFNTPRTVILVTAEEDIKDQHIIDVLRNVLADRSRSFIIDLDEKCDAVVVEDKTGQPDSMQELCETIIDTVNAELMIKAMVTAGNTAVDLSHLNRSYREARIAYEVGRIFMDDRRVLRYDALGLERLLHAMPGGLRDNFLREVFKDGSGMPLDRETINTVMKFFENNLNTSETAKQLYIHRNTLLYRLEKIYRLTGLDLKRFGDAVLLKIAILLEKERFHAGI